MPCRAGLFDLDGTLVETLRDLADSTNHGPGRLGLSAAVTGCVLPISCCPHHTVVALAKRVILCAV